MLVNVMITPLSSSVELLLLDGVEFEVELVAVALHLIHFT